MSEVDTYVKILTGTILNLYYNDCVFHIYDKNLVISIENYPAYFIESSAGDLKNLRYHETQRCQNFVLRSKNITRLFDNVEYFLQRKSMVRFNNRKYLIISEDIDQAQFYKSNSLDYVTDVVIVNFNTNGLNNESYFELFTHIYVGRKNNNKKILLDYWFPNNLSFLFGNNLYPNKIKNQMGRVLKIGGSDYLPYSLTGSNTGFELKFMVEYALKHNITSHVSNDKWGTIYSNWTGDGILGGVITDKYDIGLSALFLLPERIIYADFSVPTAFSRVTCLVPLPKQKGSWMTYITVLSFDIWALIILSYFLMGAIIYLHTYLWTSSIHKSKCSRVILIYGLFVAQPLPAINLPKVQLLRAVYLIMLVLTLLYFTIYNSRISAILSVPKLDEIETVPNLADSGLLWGEMAIDWVLPLKVEERDRHKILYTNFRVKTEAELRQLSLQYNFAFGIERLMSGYHAVGSYIKEDVIKDFAVMKEDLYRQYTNLQLRKNSVLLESINYYLAIITEAGLLNFWESEAIYLTNFQVQTALKNIITENEFISLKLVHVKGVFLYWGIGLTISLVTYIGEIVYTYILKRRRPRKIIYRWYTKNKTQHKVYYFSKKQY